MKVSLIQIQHIKKPRIREDIQNFTFYGPTLGGGHHTFLPSHASTVPQSPWNVCYYRSNACAGGTEKFGSAVVLHLKLGVG